MPTLFVDLDGVLADFDKGYETLTGKRPSKATDSVDWQLVKKKPNFYRDLPEMADALTLWTYVSQRSPIILSGVPTIVPSAAQDKRLWVRKLFGPQVPVICCKSKDKSLHMSAGDVIIDDWDKYRHLWVARGGVWVTHTSADDSIAQLKKLGL